VDPEPIEEDDEWEWEIAMARARAAAEWAEEAAQVTQPAARAKRATSPIELVVKSRRKDPIQTDNWPKTEPLMEQWDGPSPVVRVLPRAPSPTPPKPIVIAHAPEAAMPAAPVAREFALRPPAPTPTSPTIVTSAPRATVIPVPTLSRAVDPKSITPRTRTNTAPLPRPPASVMAPPKRYPRSTDPVGATTEDTLVNGTAAPANDDATTPGLILPPASSTRRVAAKQR
jgi:hypothetical protein